MQKTRAIRQKKNNNIVFVDIKGIEELKGIRREDDCLIIGSATTLDELIHSELIATYASNLIQAAEYVGSMELRNRATVGGNICTKNPAADLLVPLLAQNARVEVCDLSSRKEVDLAEVIAGKFRGFGRRTIITAIKVPVVETMITGYRRWTRESMGRSYLTSIVALQPTEAGEIAVKVVIGGAGLWPASFTEITSLDTVGNIEKRKSFCEMLAQDKMGVAVHNDTAYRRQLAWVLIYEALEIALKGVK